MDSFVKVRIGDLSIDEIREFDEKDLQEFDVERLVECSCVYIIQCLILCESSDEIDIELYNEFLNKFNNLFKTKTFDCRVFTHFANVACSQYEQSSYEKYYGYERNIALKKDGRMLKTPILSIQLLNQFVLLLLIGVNRIRP